jgi:NADH:ubiquinone oxidoreductase subunit
VHQQAFRSGGCNFLKGWTAFGRRQEEYAPRTWELPHQPNLTGTPQAWRPPGSTLAANARPPATGDYEAWTPEG